MVCWGLLDSSRRGLVDHNSGEIATINMDIQPWPTQTTTGSGLYRQ